MPLVQRAEDAKFTSRFITASDSIKSFADLKGKDLRLGAPSSTSGHLMRATSWARKASTRTRISRRSPSPAPTMPPLPSCRRQGGCRRAQHLGVGQAGRAEEGWTPEGPRAFATRRPYFDYNWTVRGDLDPKIQGKLKQAFLLDPANPAHKGNHGLQRASKFIPTKAENYKGIETGRPGRRPAEVRRAARRGAFSRRAAQGSP